MSHIDLPDEADTRAIGRSLGRLLRGGDVVTLSGDLGAGKSSFARGALAALGLVEEAASPTFPIVIAYEPPVVILPVAHVDLYRLDDPDEVEELGLDDWLADGALLIEWPERGPPWRDALALSLAPLPEGGRRLTWAAPASWEARWPPSRSER